MVCSPCASGLDHCHGTLVVHGDGLAECTDGQCTDHDGTRHGLAIDCDQVIGGCGCVADQPAEALRQVS
jgi:hypothetical protein